VTSNEVTIRRQSTRRRIAKAFQKNVSSTTLSLSIGAVDHFWSYPDWRELGEPIRPTRRAGWKPCCARVFADGMVGALSVSKIETKSGTRFPWKVNGCRFVSEAHS